MKPLIKQNKNLVIIQTPVSYNGFTQVTVLMTDEEFEEAKLERPDLVFKLARDLPVDVEAELPEEIKIEVEDETKGLTVRGMTLPADLDTIVNKLFTKEE